MVKKKGKPEKATLLPLKVFVPIHLRFTIFKLQNDSSYTIIKGYHGMCSLNAF